MDGTTGGFSDAYLYPDSHFCRAGHCRRGRQNRAAGLSMDGRTFWSLYQNVTAGAQSGGAVYGSHWSQDQYDGASARYPFPGSYLER